ncbi:MAG: hypothetical protein WAV54_00895 [Acidimicrobiales bacterium]
MSIWTLDGLQVLDSARLLVLFTAHRRVRRDVVDHEVFVFLAGEPD